VVNYRHPLVDGILIQKWLDIKRRECDSLEEISNDSLVTKARRGVFHTKVWFTTGIKEKWCKFGSNYGYSNIIFPDDSEHGDKILIKSQFFRHQQPFLSFKDWEKGSFVQQRLAIQKIIKWILEVNGDYFYPKINLQEKYYKLQDKIKKGLTKENDKIRFKRSYKEFMIIALSLMPWQNELWPIIGKPYRIYSAVCRCTRKKQNLDMLNIYYYMIRRIKRITCPSLYCAIMKKFNLSDLVVYDPYPDMFGSKAIAFTVSNCQYKTSKSFPRMEEFLGTSFKSDNYDLVILDNFSNDPLKELNDWREKAGFIIMLIKQDVISTMPIPDARMAIMSQNQICGWAHLYVS